MIVRKSLFAAVALAAATFTIPALAAETRDVSHSASPPAALSSGEITKEQAVEMALKAHPGEVTKAYQDTKRGRQAWEVKIKGADGTKWEMYYDIKTGELIAEETD